MRQDVLNHPDAQDCSLYRPDERDPDAEELDLGDGKVVFIGAFEPPREWDARQREDYFDGEDPQTFVTARIECLAEPGSKAFFSAESGDYLAVQPSPGEVVMYYVYDQQDDQYGRHYVLIRDDEEL